CRGGIAVNEFEGPADGDILLQQGQFGEGEGEEVMELVDEARALTDDGVQPAGDVTEDAQRKRDGLARRGSFVDGVARSGAGLGGMGLLVAEEGGAIVLVALRIAAGDEEGEPSSVRRWRRAGRVGKGVSEAVDEVQEVVGVLAGGIEADDEVNGAVTPQDAFKTLPQLAIAGGGLGERQFGGGGLEVVAQEAGVVAVA